MFWLEAIHDRVHDPDQLGVDADGEVEIPRVAVDGPTWQAIARLTEEPSPDVLAERIGELESLASEMLVMLHQVMIERTTTPGAYSVLRSKADAILGTLS